MKEARYIHATSLLCFILVLLFLFLFEHSGGSGMKWCAQGAIVMISKRGKEAHPTNATGLRKLCSAPDPESEDDFTFSTDLKIECARVRSPLIKLETISEDNYLQLESGYYVSPEEYCVVDDNAQYGRLCPSHSDPLWRKCCPENEILDATTFTCRPSRIKFRPRVVDKGSVILQSFIVPSLLNKNKASLSSTNNQSAVSSINFNNVNTPHYQRQGIASKLLSCARSTTGFVSKVYSTDPCLPVSSGSFHLAPNGTPMYQASTGVFLRKTHFKPVDHDSDSYCVDGLLDFSVCASDGAGETGDLDENTNNHDDDNHGKCQRREMREVLLLCMEEQETILNEDGDEKGVPKAYFFAALWLSTCPLLLSAAVANSCVIQRNVHGWILTSYLISMFLVNINSVILILHIGPSSSTSSSSLASSPTPVKFVMHSEERGCGLLDFTMKYIYMSTLCWMTSMNFNLAQSFSATVPQVVQPQRFILSALFSLGFPVLSVTVSYYVGSFPDSPYLEYHQEGSSNKPTTTSSQQTCQRGACALYSYKTLPFYYGPIILLVLCNVLAFVKTSTTIASLRRQAEAVLHKQTKDHLESFTLFTKLFLLTGSIWVIRVILLVLQIQGLYVTWYGVALEAVFSIPEVIFPMIIFHHPEFMKWAWRKSPLISRILVKCNPFCKKDLQFKEGNSLELQSANQMSCVVHHHSHNQHQHGRQTSSQGPTISTTGVSATISSTSAGQITTAISLPSKQQRCSV